MSTISLLEKLLGSVAVEWKALGDVGKFIRGKRFVKTDMVSKGFPCIHYGEMYTHYGVWANEAKSFIDSKLASKLRVANHGDVVIVTAGETIEDIGNGTAWLGKSDVVIHDACFSYKSELDPKYVSYFLRTSQFKGQIKRSISSGKISAINENGLSKAEIPIPWPKNKKKSLEAQSKIVRILDVFTELTAELTVELTAELTARKKQYNYYRDRLLSFEDGEVERKTLGELGEFIRGNGLQKKDFVEIGFPAIHYGQIYTRYGLCADETFTFIEEILANRLRKARKNDLLLATTSENDEDVVKPLAWLGDEVAISGDMMLFRHAQNVKYLAYFFQTESFQRQKQKFITGAKIRRVSSGDLSKITVPIPYAEEAEKSLAEQARIVAILDKFDALTNSISEGLPREIELRQKQYEYYRDQLFNFPKSEVAA